MPSRAMHTARPVRARGVPPVLVAPNSIPQYQFLAANADIVIGGGAAGGGKTFALLMEPKRHVATVQGFSAVIFRRTYPRITNEGGLWDESVELYGADPGAVPIRGALEWRWPATNSTVRFAHLQHEWTVFEWKGAQVPLFMFDQLEEFEEFQFWYLLSRNRSTCGVTPYVRATANPDPDSFVAKLIAWWIDQDTGYAIPARAGVTRWFYRVEGELHWADRMEDLLPLLPSPLPEHISARDLVKSLTFIPSTVYDNISLLRKNPGYLGSLMALPLVERERLLGVQGLGGNWKIRPSAGKVFNREWFRYTDLAWVADQRKRGNVQGVVRAWDKSALEEELADPEGSWTVGVLLLKTRDGLYVVLDVIRVQAGVAARDKLMRDTMRADQKAWGSFLHEWWEIEPGSGGLESHLSTAKMAASENVVGFGQHPSGSKLERARPWAAAVQNKLVLLVQAAWNEAYVSEHHACPGATMDQIDASSLAKSKVDLVSGSFDPKAWETVEGATSAYPNGGHR